MAQRGRPGRSIVVVTRCSSTEITETVQLVPAGWPRLKLKSRRNLRSYASAFGRGPTGTRSMSVWSEQREAHPSGRAIGREEQVLLAVDQHAGDAWQIRDRADVRSAATVQHVDPIGASVGDVESTATRVKVRVGVIEARFGSWRHGREAHV